MPLKPYCDDQACGCALDGKPFIAVPHIIFKDSNEVNGREAKSLFFCDDGCLRSWVVKNKNKPQLIAGPGQ